MNVNCPSQNPYAEYIEIIIIIINFCSSNFRICCEWSMIVGVMRMGYLGQIWSPKSYSIICMLENIWWEILPLIVNSAVADHSSLITMTRSIWRQLSAMTSKWHWLKSHLHSIEEIWDEYPVGQFSLASTIYWSRRTTWLFLLIPRQQTQHLTKAHDVSFNWIMLMAGYEFGTRPLKPRTPMASWWRFHNSMACLKLVSVSDLFWTNLEGGVQWQTFPFAYIHR